MHAVIERQNKLSTGLFEAQWESEELRTQSGAAWRLLPSQLLLWSQCEQPLTSRTAAHHSLQHSSMSCASSWSPPQLHTGQHAGWSKVRLRHFPTTRPLPYLSRPCPTRGSTQRHGAAGEIAWNIRKTGQGAMEQQQRGGSGRFSLCPAGCQSSSNSSSIAATTARKPCPNSATRPSENK